MGRDLEKSDVQKAQVRKPTSTSDRDRKSLRFFIPTIVGNDVLLGLRECENTRVLACSLVIPSHDKHFQCRLGVSMKDERKVDRVAFGVYAYPSDTWSSS